MTPDLPSLEDVMGQVDLEQYAARREHHAPKAPGTWKQALQLRIELENFIRIHGPEHCALLTLLFAHPRGESKLSPAQAQKIFKKAARTLLPSFFCSWISVLDYHRSGAIHFHLLVRTRINIRDGWNFEIDELHRQIQSRVRKEKRSMSYNEKMECRRLAKLLTNNPAVKAIWKRLRKELADLGFAKEYPFELKPVRNPAGLAFYLSGRYRESRGQPLLRPQHSRCVRYSNITRCVDQKLRFSPVGPGATLYRKKKAAVGAAFDIYDVAVMEADFGKGWEHQFRDILFPVNPRDTKGFFSEQYREMLERVSTYKEYSQSNPQCGKYSILDDLADLADATKQSAIPFRTINIL